MKYDEYMRHLDLRHNRFTAKGLLELLDALRDNQSFVSIELKGNPGHKDKIHQMFALELLNKLDRLKKMGKYIEQGWIKNEVFHVQVPKKVMKQLEKQRSGSPGINIITSNYHKRNN